MKLKHSGKYETLYAHMSRLATGIRAGVKVNQGQTIGYVEGREAAQPFEQSPPIDAINAALIDEIFYNPMKPA